MARQSSKGSSGAGSLSFAERVYALCRKIPRGKVSTYGEIARVLRTSPRAVGQALRCNPSAPEVPCHRVVCSDGSIGGFRGEGKGKEVMNKRELLRRECISFTNRKINVGEHLFWF